MGQGEDDSGDAKAEDSTKAPCVGRLVMRGKTCEVKAAEPKFSRSNRRSYQNQGGPSTTGPPRRFVEKAHPQPNSHANYAPGPGAPHATPFHDPHYMAANQYAMVNPSYYPAYHHPGIHHGAAAYHPSPMYAPFAPTAPMHGHNDGLYHPYVVPLIGTHVEGAHVSPYMEAAAAAAAPDHGYVYPAAAYGHPQMVPGAYHPHPGMQPQPPMPVHTNPLPAYPAPGTPASAMHPAAPGLPTKDE